MPHPHAQPQRQKVKSPAADITAAILLLFSFIWFVLLVVPSGWHRTWVCHTLQLETGLYKVYVENRYPLINKNISDPGEWNSRDCAITNNLQRIRILTMPHGNYGFGTMETYLCSSYNPLCAGWGPLYYGSSILLFLGILIIISHWCAAGFICSFFHSKGTEGGRKAIRIFLILNPSLALLGILQYFLLSKGFGDYDQSINYGPSFFFAILLTLLSNIPLIVFETTVNKKAKMISDQHTDVKAQREFEFDQQLMARNSQMGSPGAYGGQPAYGQQAPYPGHHGSAVQMGPYPGHQGSMGGYPMGGYPSTGSAGSGPGYPQPGGRYSANYGQQPQAAAYRY